MAAIENTDVLIYKNRIIYVTFTCTYQILNYIIVEQLDQGSPEYDHLTVEIILGEVYFLSTSGRKKEKKKFSN